MPCMTCNTFTPVSRLVDKNSFVLSHGELGIVTSARRETGVSWMGSCVRLMAPNMTAIIMPTMTPTGLLRLSLTRFTAGFRLPGLWQTDLDVGVHYLLLQFYRLQIHRQSLRSIRLLSVRFQQRQIQQYCRHLFWIRWYYSAGNAVSLRRMHVVGS